MKCPNCNKTAATFSEWGSRFTAFSHECPHCGTLLKASRETWFSFLSAIIVILIMLLALFASEPMAERLGISTDTVRLVILAVFLLILFLMTYLNWKNGSYAEQAPVEDTDAVRYGQEDATEDRILAFYRRSVRRRAVLFLLSSMAILGLLTYLRGYVGLVQLFGRTASATVDKYEQEEDGLILKGDWHIAYSFKTAAGDQQTGRAAFPPKKRPKDGIKQIDILYLSWWPSVSAVKGYVSLAGLFGYALGILILSLGICFLLISFPNKTQQIEDEAQNRKTD